MTLADLWDRVKKEIQTRMIKSLILHREESGRHVGALVKKNYSKAAVLV